MKRLTESLAAKITAIILSFFAAAFVVISAAAVCYMIDNGYYTKKPDEIKEDIADARIMSSAAYTLRDIYSSSGNLESYAEELGIYFTITDSKTKEVTAGNYNGEKYMFSRMFDELTVTVYGEPYYVITDQGEEYYTNKEIGTIDIMIYVPEDGAFSGETALWFGVADFLYSVRYTVFFTGGICLLLWIILLCFLYSAAGHRKEGTVKLNHLDRIPFDLVSAAVIAAAAASIALVGEAGYGSWASMMTVVILTLSADYFIALGFTMTFATRLKTRTLIKNTVIYRFLKFLFKKLKSLFGFIGYNLKNIPLVIRTAAICGAAILFQLIVYGLFAYNTGEMVVFWLFFAFAITAIVIYVAITLQKIKEGGERIAGGDLDYKIDTKYMYGDFKDFCGTLNNINKGISAAVSEKMKSERFKTELITNVSHDIKTPLTSIINYVDLIKKEESENGKIREYIAVLDRQSGRLKKLIEDLVEASKASSGSVAVNLAECDPSVLLSQTVGEFDERLKAAGLTAVINTPEKPVRIMADGRHLWRVFDNLMNNICKYSQKGTRVYLDVSESGGRVNVTFENISAYELNISGEELTERFVRGDRSRSTEGSGLGLSIARSLTEIQGGTLKIDIDGDLFKVTVSFGAV